MIIMKRFFIACLLVIFTTSLIAFLLTAVSSLFDGFSTINFAVLVATIAGAVSVVIVVVWVAPIYLILVKRNVVGLGWYILLSLVPSLAFPVFYSMWAEIDFEATIFASCLISGTASALVFWYVAVRNQ